MRSRYTAHARANVDYIKKTLVPEARKEFDPAETKKWAEESKWKGLKIVSTKMGGPKDTVGIVEFIATYEREGTGVDHHEVSQFKKIDGEWLFVDGEAHEHAEGEGHHAHEKQVPVVRDPNKVGRNDPCPCGSGKKYKKCCG